MLLYLIIAALVVAAALGAWQLLRRENVIEEVDRFRHVRSLTTSWAAQQPADEAEPAE